MVKGICFHVIYNFAEMGCDLGYYRCLDLVSQRTSSILLIIPIFNHLFVLICTLIKTYICTERAFVDIFHLFLSIWIDAIFLIDIGLIFTFNAFTRFNKPGVRRTFWFNTFKSVFRLDCIFFAVLAESLLNLFLP